MLPNSVDTIHIKMETSVEVFDTLLKKSKHFISFNFFKMILFMMSLLYLLIIVDCPVGYFGFHCSNKCPPPSYGVHCSQVCECLACDHAFGCILNTESQGTNYRVLFNYYTLLYSIMSF